MSSDKRYFTVKELADLAGISPSALRAWERRFAIFSPERTQGGHRLYTLDDLKVLWFVRRQQNLGKDLKDIASRGRDVLVSEALHYFETQTEAPQSQTLSQTDAILEALRRGHLGPAMDQVDALSLVSLSPQDFALQAMGLVPRIVSGREQGSISSMACNCALTTLAHLMRKGCLDNPFTAVPLAMVASLRGAKNQLGTLWLALLLRSWGFRIILLGDSVEIEALHEHLVGSPPRLLALGVPEDADGPSLANDISMLLAPYALTMVTAADLPFGEGQTDARQAHRFFHVVTSENLEESEALAKTRIEDDRPPAQVMLEFNRRNSRAPAGSEP